MVARATADYLRTERARQILTLLHASEPMTKGEIARLFRMQIAESNRHVRALQREGFIEPRGTERSTRPGPDPILFGACRPVSELPTRRARGRPPKPKPRPGKGVRRNVERSKASLAATGRQPGSAARRWPKQTADAAARRRQLAADVEAYLAAGHEIEELPGPRDVPTYSPVGLSPNRRQLLEESI